MNAVDWPRTELDHIENETLLCYPFIRYLYILISYPLSSSCMNDEKMLQIPVRFIWVPVLLILALTTIVTVALLRERLINPQRYQVTISGEGRTYVTPNIAVANLAVRTERAVTPAEALKDNKQKMNAVIDLLKKEGVAQADIQTTTFNLRPQYEYNREQRKRETVGFTAVQELKVKIRDLTKIGTVLEKATGAGVNTIGQLSFDVDDPEVAKAEARQKAIAQARRTVESMVKAADVRLGRLVTISENAFVPQPFLSYGYDGIGGGAVEDIAAAAAPPTIKPGQQEVVVTVSLTYEIK